jgi:hypothetical protein
MHRVRDCSGKLPAVAGTWNGKPDPRTVNCVSKQRTDDPRGTHKGEREWWLWILFRELRAPIDFVAHVAESEPLIQIERYADFGIRSGYVVV